MTAHIAYCAQSVFTHLGLWLNLYNSSWHHFTASQCFFKCAPLTFFSISNRLAAFYRGELSTTPPPVWRGYVEVEVGDMPIRQPAHGFCYINSSQFTHNVSKRLAAVSKGDFLAPYHHYWGGGAVGSQGYAHQPLASPPMGSYQLLISIYDISVLVFLLLSWLQKYFRPPARLSADQGTMTISTIEAIASFSGMVAVVVWSISRHIDL